VVALGRIAYAYLMLAVLAIDSIANKIREKHMPGTK
jgi:hypothetical protein